MATETDFTGRSALITGAASGIGAACARWLDAQGIGRLVLVDKDAAGLAALGLTCEVSPHAGDVSDPAFWEVLEPQLGKLDHAVVNAGIAAGSTRIRRNIVVKAVSAARFAPMSRAFDAVSAVWSTLTAATPKTGSVQGPDAATLLDRKRAHIAPHFRMHLKSKKFIPFQNINAACLSAKTYCIR